MNDDDFCNDDDDLLGAIQRFMDHEAPSYNYKAAEPGTTRPWFMWFSSGIYKVDEDTMYQKMVTLYNAYGHPIIATRTAYDEKIEAMTDQLETEIYQALARG